MIRLAAVAVVAMHGAIHLIGFVVPFQVAQLEGFPYRTTVLNDSIVVGDVAVRAIGIVWLVLAVGFVIAAVGLWRGIAWAVPATAVLAIVSIVVCALGLPEAVAGIVLNALILAVIAVLSLTGIGARAAQGRTGS